MTETNVIVQDKILEFLVQTFFVLNSLGYQIFTIRFTKVNTNRKYY
jgi:hypothetical protein